MFGVKPNKMAWIPQAARHATQTGTMTETATKTTI